MNLGEPRGEATVDCTFRLSGRGFIVVLTEITSGKVAIGNIVESPLGRAMVKGVEIADRRDETGKMIGHPALLVDASAEPLFAQGQIVKFYKVPATSADTLGGEGKVRASYALGARDLFVIVIENGYSGKAAVGQLLESATGRTLVKGVTFTRDSAGTGEEYVALLIDKRAAARFPKGQTVKFHMIG